MKPVPISIRIGGKPVTPMRLTPLATPATAWTAGTLLVGVAASVLLTWWHADSNSRAAQAAFESHAQDVVDRLNDRMRRYEYGLRGARGTVLTAGEHGINDALFKQYSKSRDVDVEFPGARGFGFIRRVPRSQTDNYLQAKRAEGRPDFSIRTLTEHQGERFVIEYIEPVERNRAAVGLDIGSEANRRQAAISAMQTGKATITGPITLVQAAGDPQRSLLFLLPIYRGGATPEAIEARESSAFGWSYAPLALSEVLADFNMAQLRYDLAITDLFNPGHPESVFNSQKAHSGQQTRLHQTLEREVFGRLWRFDLSARPGFVENLHLLPSRSVLAVSLLTSLLATLLMGAIQLGRERKRKGIVQQAQLATIVENSADAIVGETNDGLVISWNRAAERLFGYSRSEALGQPMIERMTPAAERDKEAQLVRQVLASAEITPTDTTLLTRQGEMAPISVTAGAIRGPQGEIIGIARLMRDISERLRAEQAMRDLAASLDQQVKDRTAELETARHDLQTVLDSVPSMIGYWDKHLRNRVANKAYGAWFGVDPTTLPGTPMQDLLRADLFERNRPYIEAALRGEQQQFERTIPRPDGSGNRHSLANYLPDIADGEVKGFYVVVHDITDIVESRHAFARERERLAHIIEGTNVGTWEWNVQTGEINVNERWADIIGYTLAELQPIDVETWKTRCHPDDLPTAQDLLDQHFRGDLPQYQSVTRMRHKAGHWVWVQSRGRVFTRTPQGEPEWMYGTHQDISAAKHAEEQLQQAVATLRSVLVAATEQSIIATDLHGTITLFNAGAEKMLGYSAHEFVGISSPATLHLAEEVEAYGQELSQRYGYPVQGFRVFVHEAERLGFENREWTYVHKDGHHLRVQLSVNAVRDAHGGLIGYLGIAQDLTERHRQDQVLRHAKTEAEAASAAKSMFLANMSHEIRTPMNAVLGIAHLLADTPLDDDQRQLLAKLQIAGRSLLGVINDVLDISKIEAGEMHAESVAFSPGDLLGELHQLYAPQASTKGVDMELRGADTLPAALLGDPTRLRQVLSNLLSNAIKFTSQGRVSLQVVQEPRTTLPHDPVWLKFSVVDTGEGISGDALENLFNPFAQADTSTTRRFGGTGLGLSIVKRLSELMGGDVGLISELGAGSTFWVRLPFMQVGTERLSQPSVADQGQLHVVVVDDSDLDRAHVVQMCQAFGWRTTALKSGTELVHWIQELADAHQPMPDALIVDWRMPNLDGLEALSKLVERIDPAALPATVIVSAEERERIARQDRKGLVDRILTKTLNPSALFNAVNASVAERTGRPDQVMQSTRMEAMQGQWLLDMRILLVDDSDINLEVASRMLQREGATVEICTNGQEALHALTAMKDTGAHFDAVLMDVQMPVMDGYEATRRARAQLGLTDLPIIALTAGALDEERRRANAAGMDAFLTKPLDPALLVRTVHAQVTRVRGTYLNTDLPQPTGSAAAGVDWPDIDGISSPDAQRLMHGDVDLFRTLLQRLVRDYGQSTFVLTDSASADERNALMARVHKLRGSSGMLAAHRLHAMATELEAAVRDGATDVQALMGSMNDALRQLTAAVETAFATGIGQHRGAQASMATAQSAGQVPAATLRAIRALQQLLDQQDLAAIQSFDSLGADLRAVLGPQAMETLSDAVHSLDFATAARALSAALPPED